MKRKETPALRLRTRLDVELTSYAFALRFLRGGLKLRTYLEERDGLDGGDCAKLDLSLRSNSRSRICQRFRLPPSSHGPTTMEDKSPHLRKFAACRAIAKRRRIYL